MTESYLQGKIIKTLEKKGWLVFKIIKCNKSGTPDLLATNGKRYVWIECKTNKGKLSAIQEYRIEQMRKKGCEVLVWRPDDNFFDLF